MTGSVKIAKYSCSNTYSPAAAIVCAISVLLNVSSGSASAAPTVSATGGQQLILTDPAYSSTNDTTLFAEGAGSQITGTGQALTLNGTTGYVTNARNGGQIKLTDASIITTGGANTIGLYASGANSSIQINGNSTLNISGYTALQVENGGSILLDGTTVNTLGPAYNGYGTLVNDGGTLTLHHVTYNDSAKIRIRAYGAETNHAHLTIEDSRINSEINASWATLQIDHATITASVQADDTTMTISNSTITASNNLAAVYVNNWQNTTNRIDIANTRLEAHNDYAAAASIYSPFSLKNSSLVTYGEAAYGLIASSDDNIVTPNQLDNVSIQTFGEYSTGLILSSLSQLRDVRVSTQGNDAVGVYISQEDTLSTAEHLFIQTFGVDAAGLKTDGHIRGLTLTDAQIFTSGVGSPAFYSEAFDTDAINTVTINDSLLDTQNAPALTINGRGLILQLNNTTLNGRNQHGNNVAVLTYNDQNVPLDEINIQADASTINGDINAIRQPLAPYTFHLSLNNQSALTGAIDGPVALALDSSSRWNVTGDSVLNNINHAGTITVAPPAGSTFKTIHLNGDYQGLGGLLSLNTRLGNDQSLTDRLIVDGNTNGLATLHINNVGGSGAATMANGIQLVQVDGASNGRFSLSGRLVAGSYEYDLYQGGVGTDASDGNWYLRSIVTPDNKPSPRPETGAYLRNLAAASTMFMHTLHDRLGELQFTSEGDGNTPAVWMRINGNHTDSQAGSGLIDVNTDTSVLQFGSDLARWSTDGDNRWHLGLMAGYGRSDVDADPAHLKTTRSGFRRSASGNVEGYSVGVYATWFGDGSRPSGAYVDAWINHAWFNNKVEGYGLKTEDYDSKGWTVSLESGYAFLLTERATRQWVIEPQVQLAYSRYDADDHREANGTWVRNTDGDGFTTRLGARLFSRSTASSHGVQPFIEANWWHSDAKNAISFNDMILSDDMPSNRYELKTGLQGDIAKGWQVWGHIGGQWGKDSYSRYEGMLGVRKIF